MEKVSLKKIARATVSLLEKYPVDQVMKVVAQELVMQRRGRENEVLLEEIMKELWQTQRHAVVTVRSARELPRTTLSKVTAVLKARLGAATMTVDEVIDPAQKGGFIATTPLGTLDASVAGRLIKLRHF